MTRGKRIITAVVLGLFGVAAALAVLEIAVRIAGIAPTPPDQFSEMVRDDAIVFKRRPGSIVRGTAESGEYAFEYAHNSLGFRDTEHALDKPPHTIRIVAVGNSFTYGAGAEFSDTFLAQLERRLNARPGEHERVEIINFGMPRHFPLLERLTLERYGLQYAPDIVLVTVLPSDVINTRQGLDAVCAAEAGYLVPCAALAWSEVAVRLYLHSALDRVVVRLWNSSGDGVGDAAGREALFAENGPYESAWRSLEHELQRMQDDARAHGAAFVVVALLNRPPWRDFVVYHEQRLQRWSAEHGAVFVPTLAALRAADPSIPIYWHGDGHCTPAGYGIVADTIAAALVANGLAP